MCEVGIYRITSPTGAVYIGGTRKFTKRVDQYRRMHNRTHAAQRAIAESLKTYGFENHTIELICPLPVDISNEVLLEYETLYAKQFRDCGVECLHLKDGNDITESVKVSISNTVSRKYAEDPTYWKRVSAATKAGKGVLNPKPRYSSKKGPHGRSVEIAQLDLEGNLVKVWDSIKDAALTLDLNGSNISHCLAGRAKTNGGSRWMRLSEFNNIKTD